MLKIIKNFLPIGTASKSEIMQFIAKIDLLGIFDKDPFGNYLIVKRLVIFIAGWPTFWRLAVANKLKIEGAQHLKNLPNKNVFFISNHQTYFADVISFYHIFSASKWGFNNKIYPVYLFSPRARTFYVAASETMKDGLLPKLFSLAGAILVERSWRAKGQNVQRNVDEKASDKIQMGLDFGWVISFPQGTTSPYAPVRKGTAHIIKENKPIVVPVVIDGFRRAFNKTGLSYKKRNTTLHVRFKEPVYFNDEQTLDEIVDIVTDIIGQTIPENIAEWRADYEES